MYCCKIQSWRKGENISLVTTIETITCVIFYPIPFHPILLHSILSYSLLSYSIFFSSFLVSVYFYFVSCSCPSRVIFPSLSFLSRRFSVLHFIYNCHKKMNVHLTYQGISCNINSHLFVDFYILKPGILALYKLLGFPEKQSQTNRSWKFQIQILVHSVRLWYFLIKPWNSLWTDQSQAR